jgi:hypothetical protein
MLTKEEIQELLGAIDYTLSEKYTEGEWESEPRLALIVSRLESARIKLEIL